MLKRVIKLKEAVEFIKENGYLLAVYKKQGDNYVLYDDCHTVQSEDENTNIVVNTIGKGIDFNEFVSEDGENCFRLHNNFNLPNIIPILK